MRDRGSWDVEGGSRWQPFSQSADSWWSSVLFEHHVVSRRILRVPCGVRFEFYQLVRSAGWGRGHAVRAGYVDSGASCSALELRTMAREAALGEIASSKVRLPLAHTQSFGRGDVKAGDSALSYKVVCRDSARWWRSPATIVDIDVTGVAVNFQGQTFNVAGFCARRRVDPKDVGEVELNPASDRREGMEA